MRLLVFSTLFPNAAQPTRGTFVEQRLQHLLRSGRVTARVLAPVPWFPVALSGSERYGEFARVPRAGTISGVEVQHPRYPVVPKIGMNLAPILMAIAMIPSVRRMLRGPSPPQLIDAHYFYPDGVAAALLGRWFNLPVVITARGSDINQIAEYTWPRQLIRWAAKRAAGVIAVSAALRDRLVGLGVPDSKIRVLRNGVDLQRFRPVNIDQAREQTGGVGHTLLYVGHLKQGKGIALAVEALKSMPDTRLVIVGDGVLRNNLESWARECGVDDRVRFVGSRPHEELLYYYAAADALLLPSEREGMPNVVLEALACGTPVIATNVGGIPEVVSVPETGLLMTERTVDCLVKCVLELRAICPDRDVVRQHAESFGWGPTTEGQLSLFSELIENT